MLRQAASLAAAAAAVILTAGCSRSPAPEPASRYLHDMVAPVQRSVVTVAATGADGDILRIGSGFFIGRDGTLVTNEHVLDGAYGAQVRTADGDIYPIRSVVARNPLVDLVKVRVQIPPEAAVPAILADGDPEIADRVVVIGSPMGLAQSVSEGIISAVRDHPTNGKVYQLTAPISPGSSGGPALNLKGQVIGVITFQTARGQNLNFAVSVKALQMLTNEIRELSVAEWTIEKSGPDPNLAVSLCRQGARLSIRGKYEAALDYYQKAAEANPDDPDTWRGLGSCYVGLDKTDDAIRAFHKSIAVAPDDAAGHFLLAMYYKALGQFQREIPSLLQVMSIAPDNVRARIELGEAYGRMGRTAEQAEAYRGILKLKPDHVTALQLLGQTMGRMGRYDEALEFLRKANVLAPDNAGIYFDMGITYGFMHMPEEELRAYTDAIRVDPQMGPAHLNIALIFLKQGNRKLALQQYAILKSLDEEAAERLFKKIYPESLEKIRAPEFIE